MGNQARYENKYHKLDMFRDNLNASKKNIAEDWFNLEDDEYEFVETKEPIKLWYFSNKNRWGICLGDLRFSFPKEMEELGTVSQVLDFIKQEHGLTEFNPCPRVVRNNRTLLKRFEAIGYYCINPLMANLVKKVDMTFITDYYFSGIVTSTGGAKLNLQLNRNTPYWQRKAQLLARLGNAQGSWVLSHLRYCPDGAKCTLGHDLKWQFIVEEETTKQQIAFGAYCVEDFFTIDDQVQNQLSAYKNQLANALIDYAFYVGVSPSYAYKIDNWSNLYLSQYLGLDKTFDHYWNLQKTFIDKGMLVPVELQGALVRSLPNKQPLTGIVADSVDYGTIVALGVYGNHLLDPSQKENYFSKVHSPDALELSGLLATGDGFFKQVYSKEGIGLAARVPSLQVMSKYLNVLNENTVENLKLARKLEKLPEQYGLKINTSHKNVVSFIYYKGVHLDGFHKNWVSSDILEDIGLHPNLLSSEKVKFPSKTVGLDFTKLRYDDLASYLLEIDNLIGDSQTAGKIDNLLVNNLTNLEYLQKAIIRSYVFWGLPEDTRIDWLNKNVPNWKEIYQQAQKAEIQRAKGYIDKDSKEYVKFNQSQISIETLNVLDEICRLGISHGAKGYDFPYKVLQTIRMNERCSPKQFMSIKQFISGLVKMSNRENIITQSGAYLKFIEKER